jgi:AraC-like DNA-binding protein
VVNHRAVGAGALVYFGYGDATVEVDPGPLDAFYLLQFACHGTGQMRYGNECVDLRPGMSAACLSPVRAMRGRFDAGIRMLVARLNRSVLERHATAQLGFEPETPLEFEPHLALDRLGGTELMLIVQRMAAGAGRRSSAGDEHLQRLLMTALLHVQPNTWREFFGRQAAAAHPRCVRLVQEFVDEHLGDDVSVEDLAAVGNVGVRTLYSSFRKQLGISPMLYLRNVRLERAHRLLRSGTSDSVTELAASCGFTHLGRFSAAYRVTFGELPSITRRHALHSLSER